MTGSYDEERLVGKRNDRPVVGVRHEPLSKEELEKLRETGRHRQVTEWIIQRANYLMTVLPSHFDGVDVPAFRTAQDAARWRGDVGYKFPEEALTASSDLRAMFPANPLEQDVCIPTPQAYGQETARPLAGPVQEEEEYTRPARADLERPRTQSDEPNVRARLGLRPRDPTLEVLVQDPVLGPPDEEALAARGIAVLSGAYGHQMGLLAVDGDTMLVGSHVVLFPALQLAMEHTDPAVIFWDEDPAPQRPGSPVWSYTLKHNGMQVEGPGYGTDEESVIDVEVYFDLQQNYEKEIMDVKDPGGGEPFHFGQQPTLYWRKKV